MRNRTKTYFIFSAIALSVVVLYLFYWLVGLEQITIGQLTRGLSRRSTRVVAMIMIAAIMAISSLKFQTMTQNRILTPSMIGFDSTFVLTQTVIVFVFGGFSTLISNPYYNFIITTMFMVLFSFLLYGLILRKGKNNLALLLLVGLVFRTLMSSLTSFLSRIIDPDDFVTVVSNTMPSLNNMNTDILWYLALPITLVVMVLMLRDLKYFDIMNLGEDQAKGLGVDYLRVTNRSLIYIAIMISVSTALVGSLTFLGLITVNLARERLKTDFHKPILILSTLAGVIFLVGGQFVLQTFRLNTSLAVFINLIGGLYMIYLLLKENKK
ncbi:MAG: iron chelate uptake ABC transporter family permease subunit [Paracholeplasma sp.]|nr:iron chelate uptake ABC transporter family permease subunit [Paracholeplasma sp.]MDY3195236.1 iron chelate uptake ABC transporter family permease subunit [Paracholeplasma sp.]